MHHAADEVEVAVRVFGVLFLLTLVCLVWMHLTVVQILHRSAPHLTDDFEHRDAELEPVPAR